MLICLAAVLGAVWKKYVLMQKRANLDFYSSTYHSSSYYYHYYFYACFIYFYVRAPASRDRHVSIYSLLIIFSYGYFCFITKSGLYFESHELLQYMSNTVADVESTCQSYCAQLKSAEIQKWKKYTLLLLFKNDKSTINSLWTKSHSPTLMSAIWYTSEMSQFHGFSLDNWFLMIVIILNITEILSFFFT